MKILILAPHPFYQERGTPIAVDLLIRALSERGDEIHLLTFNEGIDRPHNNLTVHRINPIPTISGLKPGFSAKKIYCDIFLFLKFIKLMCCNKYDMVHAVEESAFMALIICPFRSTPFVYDIDSSMTTQLVDKFAILKPVRGLLRFMESLPMRYAKAVVPMCDALAEEAALYRDKNIILLKDVSLIGDSEAESTASDLRADLNIQGKLLMYIGNLESYQGIDLLLESFALIGEKKPDANLVIIGGSEKDIERYKAMTKSLTIEDKVHIIGPRPVGQIGQYMSQADILVSPRTQGANTPMKVYSYLDSGVAVLATRMSTHTQVMNDDMAMLAEPDPQSYAQAMQTLLADDALCKKLAAEARATMQREHSYETFKKRVHGLYDVLETAS